MPGVGSRSKGRGEDVQFSQMEETEEETGMDRLRERNKLRKETERKNESGRIVTGTFGVAASISIIRGLNVRATPPDSPL